MANHHGRVRTAARGLGAAALLLGLVACGGDDGGTGGGGSSAGSVNAMAVAVDSTPGDLDPHQINQSPQTVGSRVVWYNVYETLLSRDASGEIVPQLATELPELVDDTTWRFTLREGVEFTNGEPLDAAAVKYSVDRIVDPASDSYLVEVVGGITGATVVDPLTVDITTEAYDPVLPSRATRLFVLPPEYSQQPDFAREPVGTGPYTLASQGPTELVLAANPDYWGGEPAIGEVTVRFVEDPTTRASALRAGEVDLITAVTPDIAGDLPNAPATEGGENPFISLDALNGVATDHRVREALNLAIDKEALADELFGGFATVSNCQIVSPGSVGYDPDLEPYPYDPDRAEELIEEAGATGETVRLASAQSWPKGREMAETVASYWDAVGLKTEIEMHPGAGEQAEGLVKTPERPTGWYAPTSDDLFDASKSIDQWLTTESPVGAYSNPEIDALAAEIKASTDADARIELLHEALEAACDDAAFVWLLNAQTIWGTSDRLEFDPPADSELRFFAMDLSD
ncbi:MAG TPA: ABC transporter substrate-binding protein [Acidimicrobiales bacterium]|nr:ABC transporter substrate-binding protein [Acidimicrobiales bacterium]